MSTSVNNTQVPTEDTKKNNRQKKENAAFGSIIILLVMIVLFAKYIVPQTNTHKFDLEGNNLILHLNET